MTYSVELTSSARRDVAALETDVARRIGAALEALGTNPRPNGSMRLAGEKGAYRVRVGTHRIKYQVDDAIHRVLVTKIQPRREVYR